VDINLQSLQSEKILISLKTKGPEPASSLTIKVYLEFRSAEEEGG